jgi:peptidoglycan/LPS O-acetylase OafA/YrhL
MSVTDRPVLDPEGLSTPPGEPEAVVDVRAEPPEVDLTGSTERPTLVYQPGLDGLRGLAVAGVLLFHGGFSWAIGGYLGVSTFFTLSGFLITSLLLREREATGGISLKAFWGRRFRRLMPASLVALGGIVLYGLLVADQAQLNDLRGDVLAALAYVANWRFIFQDQSYADLFTSPSPVQHFWSLAIEEQFYFAFPVLAAGVLAVANGGRRVFMAVLGIGALASTLAMVLLHEPGLETTRVYYGTGTRAVELLAGALLATVTAGYPLRLRSLGRRVVTVLGGMTLFVVLWWWGTVDQSAAWLYEGGLTVYALCSVVLIVVATSPGPIRRLLSVEPLRQLGRISYGVYLFHWPIFLWLSPERTGLPLGPLFVLRMAVTLSAALLSFRLIEQPVRRGRLVTDWRRWVAPPIAIAGVAAAALIITSVVPDRGGVAAALDDPTEAQDPAAVAAVAGPETNGTGGGATTRVERALLVGDSVTGEAYASFEQIFAAAGITTAYAGGPGTGPLKPQNSWFEQVQEWVRTFDPDVVVIEACCDYTSAPEQLYVDGDGNQVLPNTDAAFAAWDLEMRRVVDAAGAAGARVFVAELPPVQTNGFYGPLESQVERLNALYQNMPVNLVDWNRPFANPDGSYTETLPGPDGLPIVVRLADGVHMTPPGSDLLAEVTLERVLETEEHPAL